MELIQIKENLFIDNTMNFYKKQKIYLNGKQIVRTNENIRFTLTEKLFENLCRTIGDIPDLENGCYYKKLKVTTTKNGYPSIANGKKGSFALHRIVAEHFIENPENKPQVNHIDGNKNNYMIDNLEWVTVKENINHAITTGLSDRTKFRKEVYIYKTDGSFFCKTLGLEEAEKITNVDRSYIVAVIKGDRKSGKGFVFSDKEIEFKGFNAKPPKAKVLVEKLDGSFSKVYDSVTQARKELNLFNVFKHLKGEYKQVNGYTVKYI